MKKIFFPLVILSVLSFTSCGPGEDEIKKMQEEADNMYDSLVMQADKKIAEDLRKQDSANATNQRIQETDTSIKIK